MPIGLTLVTPPAVEPVSLAEAKLHCRVDHDAENDNLAGAVMAARQYVEDWTGRALVAQTWRLTLDGFPAGYLRLPRGRVQSVTSVTYDDGTSVVTMPAADYRLNNAGEPARLEVPDGGFWPATYAAAETVNVTYVAGYGDDHTAVPPAVKRALLMLTQHYYDNRGPVAVGVSASPIDFTVKALLGPYWLGEYG